MAKAIGVCVIAIFIAMGVVKALELLRKRAGNSEGEKK